MPFCTVAHLSINLQTYPLTIIESIEEYLHVQKQPRLDPGTPGTGNHFANRCAMPSPIRADFDELQQELLPKLAFVDLPGVGVAMTRDPATLMVGQYFKRKRELIEIILVSGSGLGIAAMSVFIKVVVRLVAIPHT